MLPIHDVDVLLLLALALSSKRRPAELVEVIAAADVIQGAVPSELRLIDAFSRLAGQGLICKQDGGYVLTAEAQAIMANPSRKVDIEKRLPGIKDKLAAHQATGEHPAIQLTAKQVCAAILAHRASSKLPGKNLLIPKPKPAEGTSAGPGLRQRKPLPTRRRKG